MVLDPRFKLVHFKETGLLYFYASIESDIIDLLKSEYNRLVNNNNEPDELTNQNSSNNQPDYDSDNDLFQGNRNQNTAAEYTQYFNEGVMPQQVS